MNPYDSIPPTASRRRRTEHFADSYEADPSQTAPQQAKGTAEGSYRAPAAGTPVEQKVVRQTQPTGYPQSVQTVQPARQPSGGYPVTGARLPQNNFNQQGYPAYPQQNGWAQPNVAPNGWQQPNDSQALPQLGSSAAQQNGGWSQPYRPQQMQGGWQQPYYGNQQMWQGGSQQQTGVEQRPVLELQEAQRPHAGGGEPPKRKKPLLWIILIAAAVVILVVAAVIAGTAAVRSGNMHEQVSAYNNRFCEGVYVDDIHLGGMTQQEAINAVTKNAQTRRDSWYIRLEFDGRLAGNLTADTLGMTVNVTDALAAAWEQGHASSDVSERKAAMDALLEEPYYGYTTLPSGSTAALDKFLQDIARNMYIAPQDAYLKEFDPARTYPFVIAEETYGQSLNTTALKTQLMGMISEMESGTIELAPDVIRPQVTKADLEKKYALRGSAYTLISTTSTENRDKNILRACELISGTIIKPGENFSFNTVVGARTEKNGFYTAIEYAYGNEREGYGGGVCQVSTTIYIAAVRANMEIKSREQHSDKVNYTAYGLDATVNLDGKKIDFVFRNNTSSNIYIKAKVEYDPKIDKNHKYVLIEIYGESLGEGVTYDLIAETVEILPAPTEPEYVADKTGDHVTYIDQEEIKRYASDGCIVESFKVQYVNGEEVNRTYMYRDTYKAKAQQIWHGVTDREPEYWENGGY